jgi:hypothetical protein
MPGGRLGQVTTLPRLTEPSLFALTQLNDLRRELRSGPTLAPVVLHADARHGQRQRQVIGGCGRFAA